MRSSTSIFTILTSLVTMSLLTSCGSSSAPDQPTVLGTPPDKAILGAEFFYNFGAFGGDQPPTFSLSNAPSWLALENTTNKARTGIILSGVPGITGGRVGEADLGPNKNITVVVNDGKLFGSGTFDITVEHNALTIDKPVLTEGEGFASDEPITPSEACVRPDTSLQGSWTQDIQFYNPDGTPKAIESRTYPTHPALIKVQLTAPPVEPVSVAFELRTNFNPATCDLPNTVPHKKCEFSIPNLGKTELPLPGHNAVDVIATSGTLTPPDYIQYGADKLSGVVTFGQGIKTCFIPVEVVEDPFPETAEFFEVRLTEVRQGLASLNANGASASATIQIDDNESLVSFDLDADTINEKDGVFTDYVAKLDKPSDKELFVRLIAGAGSSTATSTDFRFFVPEPPANPADDNGSNFIQSDLLRFAPNETEVTFRIEAPVNDGDPFENDPNRDDDLIAVTVDRPASFGEENFARASENETIRVSINEWLNNTTIGQAGDFVPAHIAVGDNGRVFVAGTLGGRVELRVYNRFGAQQPPILAPFNTGSSLQLDPDISFRLRNFSVGSNLESRREVAVAFTIQGALASTTAVGGADIGLAVFRRDAEAPGYTNIWNYQTGSTGDDVLKSVRIDDSGTVFLAGNTTTNWAADVSSDPVRQAQLTQEVTLKGGSDVFVQRVDNQDTQGAKAWTRLVGSPLNERLVALGATFNFVYPIAITSGGNLASTGPFGDDDLFFAGINDPVAELNPKRTIGTELKDEFNDGTVFGNQMWAVGQGPARYSVVDTELSADTVAANSVGGLVINSSLSGVLNGVLNLNDKNDTPNAIENLLAIDAFGTGSAIAAGFTSGEFETGVNTQGSTDAIVARVTQATGLEENWRLQFGGMDAERVIDVAVYQDREAVVLVEVDDGSTKRWELRLLTTNGVLLTN